MLSHATGINIFSNTNSFNLKQNKYVNVRHFVSLFYFFCCQFINDLSDLRLWYIYDLKVKLFKHMHFVI